MKKPELLAPAGNYESLIAAVEAGCDAVYLSGKLYGARSFAGNFDNNELISAVEYCHKYGVRVYVTVNTLIYESEIKNFMKYIDFLYVNNVDAIILQDIGMFDLIRKSYPNFEIHISTQMHVHNLEGCKLFETYGAKRVVLARETSYELLKEIRKKTNLELEIFVHGALCISYSGQCLMSSLIGGRSGNRGTCAQCCRQPYDLYCNNEKINDDKYLLSTRDLNSLENIGKLIDIGIDSFKIEGRMKRPEYVYYVVSLYRKAIDNYLKYKETKITENDVYDLKKIFNRKFTKGFLFNSSNSDIVNTFRPNHMGIIIGTVVSVNKNKVSIKLHDTLNVQDGIRFIGKKDIGFTITSMFEGKSSIKQAIKNKIITINSKEVPNIGDIVVKTTDNIQLKNIQKDISNKKRKVDLKLSLTALLDNNVVLNVSDYENNNCTIKSDYIVQKSLNSSTTLDNILKQLNKTNDTIYAFVEHNINIDKDIFIPVGVLNDLKRSALEEVNNIRNKKRDIIKGEYTIEVPNFYREQNINVLIDSTDRYNDSLLLKYNEVVIDDDRQESSYYNVRKKLPRVLEHLDDKTGKLLVGELGSIFKYCKDENDVATDFSLNVTNSYSVAFLHSIGVKRITLSLELNEFQIKKIVDNYCKRYGKHPNLEVILADTPEAMVLKYDIFNGKYVANNKYFIKDKYNNKFKVLRKNNLTYIYNYYSVNNKDYNKYFELGINNVRINSIFL